MKPFKVFRLQSDEGYTMIAARTHVEAIQCLCEHADMMSADEIDAESEMTEYPMHKWRDFKVYNDDYDEEEPDGGENWEYMTMEQLMANRREPGVLAESGRSKYCD